MIASDWGRGRGYSYHCDSGHRQKFKTFEPAMRQRKSMKGKHYQLAFTLGIGVQKKLYGTHLKFKILILYSWILFTTILRKVMTKNENSRPSGTCSIRKAEFDNFVLYKAFKNSCEIPQNPDFDAQLFKSSTLL